MLSSSKAVQLNYHDFNDVLKEPETEHNWAAKETVLKTLGSACHSSIAQNHEFVVFIKNHRKAFAECLLTERTRLSGTACELVEKLSTAMGRDFGVHFPDLFTGPLLKVCARTNKVMVTRSLKALNSIVNAGCVTPLPKACQAFSTNNKALRISCISIVASCVAYFPSQELEPYLASFEPVLKEGVSDAAPEVRDTSRKSFKIYAEKFPDRSQMMTTTLPSTVLKYLLPDAKSTSTSHSRTATATAGRGPALNRLADEPRHQSSRELNAGVSRGGPGRVGPVRARTMAVAEHSPTSPSFKVPTLPASHASQSAQPYSYHGTQQAHSQAAPSSQSHLSLTRNHGPASRSNSIPDTSESSGHGIFRSNSQRRTFSTSGASVQRTPSINLATNGGPQRVVPPAFNAEAPKLTRSSTLPSNRLTKAEPAPKTGRMSALINQPGHANHVAASDRETMSAHERAKAYSANLKSEKANRRSIDLSMRSSGLGVRRSITDHGGFPGYGSLSSAPSTAPTSTATSTTTVSPASSSSTSPTTMNPPNHDALFSTFRASVGSQLGTSPPESCSSPDGRHSTPPTSQHFDDIPTSAPAPLSPRVFEQVSLESGPRHLLQQQYHQEHLASILSAEPSAPLSPHSPLHHQSAHSYPMASASLGDSHSPSHEGVQVDEQQDFEDSYAEDTDYNMSMPDHASLFGATEDYLKMEQEMEEEVAEIEQEVARNKQAKSDTVEDKHGFMDEDPEAMDHEHLEVKAYADDYEARLAAASCSSTSLPSSHEEE